MYEDSAHDAYDILNSARGKDYVGESSALAAVIREHDASAQTLLDVGCGTGRHMVEFQTMGFECVGTDLSPAMVAKAATRLDGARIEVADIRTMDLGATFDAVICLNGTIGYMTTKSDLDQAVSRLVRHVSPKGVLVVEPWMSPAQWLAPMVGAESGKEGDIAVARVSRAFFEDGLGVFERHCSIATPERAWSFVEVHRMGLYEISDYKDAFAAAGMTARHDEFAPGRGVGILVGTRP
ncbi:MAG TPA: class I SAM-dependent methyltransferase [Acidimicrobiales bacterium]|nr:class I SAM-dependent methyltransferase [Acidimicrobiales bacterium]